ncbi:MAG TPA: tunicamycin resistance protein [Rubrobacter sp.]|nr:tunicamycin resistance protein [Rubrobacter sp.]
MILFINGPFGVGKTSVSKLLDEKIPDAMLYDPEVIGAVLKRVLGPFKKVEDYQDYDLWRTLVVGGVRVLRRASARTLIIPMTVWRRDLFDPIITGLRRIDGDLACFRLTASRDVLMDRISSDTEDREARAWRTSHADICLEALRDPAFGTEVRTDDRAPGDVADRILQIAGMPTG